MLSFSGNSWNARLRFRVRVDGKDSKQKGKMKAEVAQNSKQKADLSIALSIHCILISALNFDVLHSYKEIQ